MRNLATVFLIHGQPSGITTHLVTGSSSNSKQENCDEMSELGGRGAGADSARRHDRLRPDAPDDGGDSVPSDDRETAAQPELILVGADQQPAASTDSQRLRNPTPAKPARD